MVRDIGKCHDGAIVGRGQIAVVDRAQPLAADSTEMELVDRARGLNGQRIQQPQLIEHVLPVRLKNLPAQALRWPRRLLKDDRPDAFLSQGERQHSATSTGPNYGNVGFFDHASSAATLRCHLTLNIPAISTPGIAPDRSRATETCPAF